MRKHLKAPESGCERWGSLLHSLWDSVSGWGPDRMVSRLLIREAGFDGVSLEHDDIVHELAVALDGWMGKSASLRRSRIPTGNTRDAAENIAVRRELRDNPILRQVEECGSALRVAPVSGARCERGGPARPQRRLASAAGLR